MKSFLPVALVIMLFSACYEEVLEGSFDEQSAPTITIGFEDDDVNTKVQLNESQKTVWTKGDQVSVFYLSDANQKWQYQGKTGERVGSFKQVEIGSATETTKRVVVVYPYNENYYINADTYNVKAFLPAVQTYLKDSYGLDGNIMISQGEYNQFSLKNVCGWLKLQLTGNGEQVNSITVCGNNGEQVAGEIYIDSSDAASVLAADMGDVTGEEDNFVGGAGGSLIFDDTILTEVTLVCPDGVTLGAETTSFYIALPPQTFSKGIMIEVDCNDGNRYCKFTQKSITIDRNTIQPLSAINPKEDMDFMDPDLPPYDEIWYTSTTGEVVPLMSDTGFGANIVSNTYEDGKGIIKFDGIVTAVGAYAYNNDYSPNQTLETVTLPTSVTSIGELAFRYCRALKEINLHDGITHIGERAFIYTNLAEITIPKGLTELSKQVFDSTPLKSIVIPDNIKKICERAFCLCDNLETIVIGDGVTEIELCAFETWRPATVSVILGKNVSIMGDNVFDGCTGKLFINGNVIPNSSDGTGWIYGADFSEIIIGDEVEAIPDYAFYSYSTLPLTKITIGKGVKSIGKNVLHMPVSEINVRDLKSYCQIDFKDSIIDGANLLVNDQNTTSVSVPDGVTGIPPYAFQGCANLQFLTIPDSVTSIGDYAFSGCGSLRSVNEAKNVQTIGDYSFSYCSSLCYMPMTSNLTHIGNWAFAECKELSLSMSPYNVKTVGTYAFYKCNNLNNSLDLRSATSIGGLAFYYCSGIKTLDISSATTIGRQAFYNCSNLREVIWSDDLTRIEESTFSYTALTDVELPDRLEYIGESAFYHAKLESLVIPESVTYIDCYAFESNNSLSTVYCKPTTPPEVGTDYDDGTRYWSAFSGCAKDCKFYVPQSSLSTYQSAKYWSSYKNYMVGYDF